MTIFTNTHYSATELTKGEYDVLVERTRQKHELGYTAEHDDANYTCGDLAEAGSVYAYNADLSPESKEMKRGEGIWEWPWSDEAYKPRTEREDLVRAAALILARIDQLDRQEARQTTEE